MESIGEKLRKTREDRGFSLDQVARDTNIAKRFITALENEDFAAFPGEPYLLGFIRNYSDFLGLDARELISLYRNIKLQAEPVPMDALLKKPGPRARTIAIAGILIVVVGGLVAAGIFYFANRPVSQISSPPEISRPRAAGASHQFREEIIERPFNLGDEIVVFFGDEEYPVVVEEVGAVVVLKSPTRRVELAQGQTMVLELSPDMTRSVRVSSSSIQKDAVPPRAVLRFDKYVEGSIRPVRPPVVQDVTRLQPEPVAAPIPAIGTTSEPSRRRPSLVLVDAAARAPFTVDLEFRNFCLFRFVADNDRREERYFRQGEVFRIDVRDEIRLWYSNAGAISARIAGRNVELGRLGQVGASLIRWGRDDGSGLFRLEKIPMY